MSFLRKGLLLSIMVFAIFEVSAQENQGTFKIGKLYQEFVDADYSTLDMPEYSQVITVKGIVQDVKKTFFDNSDKIVVSLGTEADGDEMARLIFEPTANLKKLKVGQQITVEGEMGFASGTEYIPFSNCQLK